MSKQEVIKQLEKLSKHYEDIEQCGKRMLDIVEDKKFKGLPVEVY